MKQIVGLLVLCCVACTSDIKQIYITGLVSDAENNEPISEMEVTVLCWKYGNSPDESYAENETKVVRTDGKGKYHVHFDKGAFVEVKVESNVYHKGEVFVNVSSRHNTVDLVLIKK